MFREVMSACRALEQPTRVGYLGPAGTFSEAALLQQFGASVEGEPCASIDDVFRVVRGGQRRVRPGSGRELDRGLGDAHDGPAAGLAAAHRRGGVVAGASQPADEVGHGGRRDDGVRARAGARAVRRLAQPPLSGARAQGGVEQRRGGAPRVGRPDDRRDRRRPRGAALPAAAGGHAHPGRSGQPHALPRARTSRTRRRPDATRPR